MFNEYNKNKIITQSLIWDTTTDFGQVHNYVIEPNFKSDQDILKQKQRWKVGKKKVKKNTQLLKKKLEIETVPPLEMYGSQMPQRVQ